MYVRVHRLIWLATGICFFFYLIVMSVVLRFICCCFLRYVCVLPRVSAHVICLLPGRKLYEILTADLRMGHLMYFSYGYLRVFTCLFIYMFVYSFIFYWQIQSTRKQLTNSIRFIHCYMFLSDKLTAIMYKITDTKGKWLQKIMPVLLILLIWQGYSFSLSLIN
jgi:hypothetical protein